MKSWLALCVIVLICNKYTEAKQVSGTTRRPNKKQGVATTFKKNGTVSVASAPTSATQVITTTTRKPLLPGFKLPCSCLEGQCGCCTGVILDRFNQKVCLNVTYDPDDFAITAQMAMNGRVLFKRSVSGKNPPPMCVRLPRLQFIRFCVEFSNIYFASRNVHLCIDMEANWEDLTLVEWSFDCIRMGASGVAVVGPEDGGGIPANPIDVVDQTDEDYDDSARNVPLMDRTANTRPDRSNCNALILDESVRRVDPENVNGALIKVHTLPGGDVRVSYGTAGS